MAPLNMILFFLVLVGAQVVTCTPHNAATATAPSVFCPYLSYRKQWKAVPPKKTSPFDGRPNLVLVKDTGTNYGFCGSSVKDIQTRDMGKYKRDDIDCNFILNTYGQMCEGRGWYNSVVGNKTLVLCIMEDTEQHQVDPDVKKSLTTFFRCRHFKDMINPDFKFITLRDMNPSVPNPGYYMYEYLRTLPEYKNVGRSHEMDSLIKQEESPYQLG